MGSDVQRIFDVELVSLFQRATPVVILMVLAYGANKWDRLKTLFMLSAVVYAGFLAKVYVWPEFKQDVHSWWGKYAQARVRIPELDKHAGDRYLIALVGRAYFGDLFVYDELESKIRSSMVTDGKYRLAYHFHPLAKYQDDDVVELVVWNGMVESAYRLPNCVRDYTLCEFEVEKNEALEIARRNGVSGDDVEMGTTSFSDRGLVIEVYSCRLNKRVLIDYRDGEVVSSGEAIGCR